MKSNILRWSTFWVTVSIIFTLVLELFFPKFSNSGLGIFGSLLNTLVLTIPLFILGWQIVGLLENKTSLRDKIKPIVGFIITLFIAWIFYSVMFIGM